LNDLEVSVCGDAAEAPPVARIEVALVVTAATFFTRLPVVPRMTPRPTPHAASAMPETRLWGSVASASMPATPTA